MPAANAGSTGGERKHEFRVESGGGKSAALCRLDWHESDACVARQGDRRAASSRGANNRFGALHGGAVMALADNLGGTATIANLPKGGRTATIESKTNFFASIPVGDIARAECTPLHRGRSTMVWQTRITRGDGRLCALVIQTQIVIAPEQS